MNFAHFLDTFSPITAKRNSKEATHVRWLGIHLAKRVQRTRFHEHFRELDFTACVRCRIAEFLRLCLFGRRHAVFQTPTSSSFDRKAGSRSQY